MGVLVHPGERLLHGRAHADLVDVAHVEDLDLELVQEALLALIHAADADLADLVGVIAGTCPPIPVSTSGPWPHRQATGMPWMLPDGVMVAVLRSAWASNHSTRSLRPVSRQWRATALIEPMARQ